MEARTLSSERPLTVWGLFGLLLVSVLPWAQSQTSATLSGPRCFSTFSHLLVFWSPHPAKVYPYLHPHCIYCWNPQFLSCRRPLELCTTGSLCCSSSRPCSPALSSHPLIRSSLLSNPLTVILSKVSDFTLRNISCSSFSFQMWTQRYGGTEVTPEVRSPCVPLFCVASQINESNTKWVPPKWAHIILVRA